MSAEATTPNASSGQILIVKLYERLATDLAEATCAIAERDRATTEESVEHARRIVAVLRRTLAPGLFRSGYDLMALFDALDNELAASLKGASAEGLLTCTAIVDSLLGSWQGWLAATDQPITDLDGRPLNVPPARPRRGRPRKASPGR